MWTLPPVRKQNRRTDFLDIDRLVRTDCRGDQTEQRKLHRQRVRRDSVSVNGTYFSAYRGAAIVTARTVPSGNKVQDSSSLKRTVEIFAAHDIDPPVGQDAGCEELPGIGHREWSGPRTFPVSYRPLPSGFNRYQSCPPVSWIRTVASVIRSIVSGVKDGGPGSAARENPGAAPNLTPWSGGLALSEPGGPEGNVRAPINEEHSGAVVWAG